MQSILSAISRIAGVVIVIFGLAYLTGWEVAASYFSTVGASWAVKLLTSYQVIDFGYYVVAVFAVTTALQAEALLCGVFRQSASRTAGILLTIIYVLFGIASLNPLSIINESASIAALYADSLTLSILAGVFVGQAIAFFASSGNVGRVNPKVWGALNFMLMLIIILSPIQWGEASGKLLNHNISATPQVALPGNSDLCHLISPVGSRLLVRCKWSQTSSPLFFLVAPSTKTPILSELKK